MTGQPNTPVSKEHELFRDAFAKWKAPLTLVVGSGLSAPAGIPTWPELRRKLQNDVEQQRLNRNDIGEAIVGGKLSALKQATDFWIAFKLIKELLGPPTFDALVEKYLAVDDSAEIPNGYTNLMRLQPRGVVTLNLDRFAGDAMAKANSKGLITPVYGKEIADRWNIIISGKPYLVYLHGDILNPSTWAMTQDDLALLLSSTGHRVFLQDVFLNNLVLFAGISADDIALSARLIDLRAAGFRPQNLYWLTSRNDAKTKAWADENYIKIINYQAHDSAAHSLAIADFVSDCLHYSPIEPQLPPTVNESFGSSEKVAPLQLAQEEPEAIRKSLSAILTGLLEGPDADNPYDAYRSFCSEYSYPVHRSFYRDQSDKFSEWFGYNLQFPAIGRGNFGELYSAIDSEGKLVAVKIMQDGVFNNDDMLGGFRRGVRSMKIVTRNAVDGMVPFIEAYELPPTIVMTHISGLSLEDAIAQQPNISWATKPDIAVRVAEIVSAGHSLVETILHRDLKPSNIMLRNFDYADDFEPDVVVLDFDMSWHKGSKEKDIIFESRDDFGYLAPEQTTKKPNATAQSTRVDAYGLGMTVFFLFGLEAPAPNEPFSEGWPVRALKASQRKFDRDWLSAPTRLARLIVRSTTVEQVDRIDFNSILRELRDIKAATSDPHKLENVEFWAEELLHRVGSTTPYIWNDARGEGVIRSVNGVSVKAWSDLKNQRILFQFEFIEGGTMNRTTVPRFLANNRDKVRSILDSSGFKVSRSDINRGGLVIDCDIGLDKVLNDIALPAKALNLAFLTLSP